MNEELKKIQKNMEKFHQEVSPALIPLYPGINLCYLTFSTNSFSVHHKAMPHIIQINYCKAGQIVWEMNRQKAFFQLFLTSQKN